MATKQNATTTDATKVITGLVRFSYVHVFEPTAVGDQTEKKYSVSLLIPKSDKVNLDKIKKAINAAREQGKADKWSGKFPANLKMPLRDGDVEKESPEYAGHFFIGTSSKTKPQVVDKDLNPIMDQDEFYSGCYGRASINFYPFNANGNKGVAAGLNNLQKLKEGEKLSGRPSAEEDFSDAEDIELGDDDEDIDEFM